MPAAPSPNRVARPSAFRFRLRSCASMNVAVYLAVALVLLLIILYRTQGHFTYCLDDPYIHLALADRLRHGLYGINAGEPASPSSSILWPLLLVPFAGTALMPWVPLALNLCFSSVTAWLLGHCVDRTFAPGWRSRSLSLLLLPATNIFGLTYTGLEHPLEVLLCLAGAFAVLHVVEEKAVPPWTVAAAALLPSVRYEGLLITLAVAAALWATRARRSALLLVFISLVPPAIFSIVLHSLRLPWFPMSVLIKSSYKFQDQSSFPVRTVRFVLNALTGTLREPERAPQLLLVFVLAYIAWQNRRKRSVCLTLAACAAAGGVQVLVGPVGWFFRYEIYCLAFTLVVAIVANARMPMGGAPTDSDLGSRSRDSQDRGSRNRQNLHLTLPDFRADTPTGKGAASGLLLVLTAALAMLYARPQLGVPQAALGIYEQQMQLGRFASQFETGPVAVNDLGWVSFDRKPDRYVLDLVGLGSLDAFKASEAQRTSAWLESVTRSHGVGLVMMYTDWFPKGVPATWVPVAKLCSADVDTSLGAGDTRVMFYATPLANKPRLLDELRRFQTTLPHGSVLQLHPADTSEVCAANL